MDSLDLFFKKYAYKFPKGYPDLNDEQDINLLADILENIEIDLQKEQQLDIDFPEDLDGEIKQLISKLDDKDTKRKIIKILIKASKKEDIYDEDEVKKSKNIVKTILEKDKNLASNYSNAVYRMSLNEYKNLAKYLENPTVNDIPGEGTLINLFSSVPLSIDFKKELIELYGRSTGKGEVALIALIDKCTARGGKKVEGKGDIILNGKNIEVKQGNKFQLVPFEIAKYSIKPSDFLKNETGEDFPLGESWPNTLQKYWEEEKVTIETINKILKQFYSKYVSPITPELKGKTNGLLNYITDELAKKYIEESKPILFISAKEPYNFKLINSFSEYQELKGENLKISAFSDEFPRFTYR